MNGFLQMAPQFSQAQNMPAQRQQYDYGNGFQSSSTNMPASGMQQPGVSFSNQRGY